MVSLGFDSLGPTVHQSVNGNAQMGEPIMSTATVTTATIAYVECALWSSNDWDDMDDGDNPRPMDENHGADDIAPESLSEMTREVSEMVEAAPADTWDYWTPEQFGHDFWLTRNGHGAGFWDRYSTGRGEELGRILTDASRPYGPCDLYVGDDGKVYC